MTSVEQPDLPPFASVTDEARAHDTLYATGHWLHAQRRFADAAAVFRALVACAPDDERGWLALGQCHEEVDQPEVALEIYGAGFVAASPAPRCAIARSRLLTDLGRGDEACLALDEADAAARASGDACARDAIADERGGSTP